MKKKQPKLFGITFKRSFIIYLSVVLIAILVLLVNAGYKLLIEHNNKANQYADTLTKQILNQEFNALPELSSCIQSSNTYTPRSSNIVSNREAEYTCTTTVHKAYQEIYTGLHKSFSFQGKQQELASIGSFDITNKQFRIDYYFLSPTPNNNTVGATYSPASQVDEIIISVSTNK